MPSAILAIVKAVAVALIGAVATTLVGSLTEDQKQDRKK